jgi:hypoxanthine phosphoribosyltransferase
MAARTFPCIERLTAVAKSAYAGPGGRPTPQQHFDSMRVRRGLEDFDEIVIVDDIITRGATLIAAAARLAEVYPRARIRAFAVARTKKMTAGIEEPCAGTISVDYGRCRRRP